MEQLGTLGGQLPGYLSIEPRMGLQKIHYDPM